MYIAVIKLVSLMIIPINMKQMQTVQQIRVMYIEDIFAGIRRRKEQRKVLFKT